MKRFIIFSVVLAVASLSLYTFSQSSSCKKRFRDFYNLTGVNRVEVSLFKGNDYILVKDYKKVVELIGQAEVVLAKFIPKTEVVLHNASTNTFHKVYFSESCKRLDIEGRTFMLDYKSSKELAEILNDSLGENRKK